MGQVPEKNNLIGGVDMDTDQSRIQDNRTTFQRNLAYDVNKNASAPGGEGANYGVLTPYEGSSPLTGIEFPEGSNYCIGTYESKETNEAYVFVWNSNGAHFIYRINGDATAQIVYNVGTCLEFQNLPQHFISEGRCTLITDTYTDRQSGEEKLHKYLIFTDNYNPVRFISVEDSIATDSFNPITYPYFSPDAYSYNRCEDLISLGVATSMRCIGIEEIPREEEDEAKQNLLINHGWQWRIKFIDRFGRESEHGVISDRYFTLLGAPCLQSSESLPRCVELTIDAGAPFVEKIQIEFRKCTGNTAEISDTDWFLYDTVEKYNNCDNAAWYEREINPDLDYNSVNNTFKYVFCGDKECQAIPVAETSRTQNPLPLTSSSVFPIDRGIGLANNVRGFDPLSCAELDKLSFSVTPPGDGCGNELRRVVVYAVIYNPQLNETSGIWDLGTAANLPTAPALKGIVFGNATCDSDPSDTTTNDHFNQPGVYGQVFQEGYHGFIGYMAGTQFSAVSEQYKANASASTVTKVGTQHHNTFFNTYVKAPSTTDDFLIQRWEFKVPPGKYSFRISSHASTTQEDYQRKSTYTAGTCTSTSPATVSKYDKELIVDVCTDDYIQDPFSDDVLCIYDLSYANDDCTQWGRVIDGYVKEDRVDHIPVEFAAVSPTSLSSMVVYSYVTDYNGFFFAAGSGAGLNIDVYINTCSSVVTRSLFMYDPTNISHEEVYAMDGDTAFPAGGRRVITAKFVLCDNEDVGVAGVSMVMKYGGVAVSDSDGMATLIAHQRPPDVTSPSTTLPPIANDTIIITQSGGCVLMTCEPECTFCFPDISVPYVTCGSGRDSDLGEFQVNIQSYGLKGLENGGKYGIGIVMHDWMGRHSFVQANESHYVTLPSIAENQAFDFSTVSFNMPGIVFPSWVKFVSFYATENLNNDDYLMWVADKVEFIDSEGNVNSITPSKIRIYYGSLSEYNKENSFATNTNWEFLVAGTQNSVVGDYVEFIRNGDDDETWFDKNVLGLVRYSKDGTYFDIDYTSALKDLESGCLFKLVRPKECLTKNIYYEVCSTIRVSELGIPETVTGTLDLYDSYFVSRQIPVPTQISGGVTIVNKFYNLYFEHNSPSDFYGFKCANRGRINIKNPYEREKRLGSEVALSQDITYRGSFNGLSYFIESDIFTFEEQEWGNITVVIPEINTYLFLCANDNFIVGYKDTIARTDSNGQLIAPSSAGTWGTPQRKIGSNYGCQMRDINTIRKYEGIVVFLDKQRYSLLFHNFSDVKDVSIRGYKSFLSSSINNVNGTLLAEIVAYLPYYVGGVDVYKKEYYLTSFYAPASLENPAVYNNNDTTPSPGGSETIAISLETGVTKTFTSFVPEYYLTFEGWPYRKNMFAFRHGVAWSHRGITGVTVDYNNFFGSQGPKVVRVVSNLSPEKVKKFLYNEVYCKEHKFIIRDIVTESSQESRLRDIWWEKREGFWCAEFLCATNTFADPNFPILATASLTDGDPLSGRWIESRYVAPDADKGKYCELGAIVVYMTATDKSAD